MDADGVDRVTCLACGASYGKPVAGGTLNENPGCPRCAYVGWLPIVPAEALSARRRFVLGPLPLRLDPQH